MQKVFSYDLGTNSIGWAYVQRPRSYEGGMVTGELIDSGVRIFPEAVEDKSRAPKNKKRRTARLIRRVIQRRARRKAKLENVLVAHGLLPAGLASTQREKILNQIGCPYALRSEALDHALKPYELGRVILHIAQRRGFLSNKKVLLGDLKDDPDLIAVLEEMGEEQSDYLSKEQKDEETRFKQSISKLKRNIELTGSRTLGEYLFQHLQESPYNHARNRDHAHEDFLRTDRKLYQDELSLIFAAQKPHHISLSEALIQQITRCIFYQRPLKLKAGRVGKCTLERNNNRCAAARLEAQRFRILSFVNTICYQCLITGENKPLSFEQKEKVYNELEQNPKITISAFRKMVGLKSRVKLNYETTDFNRQAIGNITYCTIAALLGDAWSDWREEKRKELVEDLLTMHSKKALFKRLTTHWSKENSDELEKIDKKTALKLCSIELPPGHAHLSLKAINKILPELQKGAIYSTACQKAGYDHAATQEVKVVDLLPAPPDLRNPVVNRGLSELRRVVNAMIQEFGKPDVISIELARDMTLSKKEKKRLQDQNKKNEESNQMAQSAYAAYAKEQGLSSYASHDDRLRYRLWKDQDKRCAYSGESINISTLFSAEIEIDHIAPLSRSLDDSYMNKVVCFAHKNKTKGQRTPYQAFGDTDKWEQIVEAISRWDDQLSAKRARFYYSDEDMKKNFTAAQLNNTQYFAKEALHYLSQLGTDTQVTKGRAVSWLRHQWNLNGLLNEKAAGVKNREDNRHHAIDALVIALTNRSLYNLLSQQARAKEAGRELRYKAPNMDPALLRQMGACLEKMIVSYKPSRKLEGALHEDTGRGYNPKTSIAYSRAAVDPDLKITRVIDPVVKGILERHLQQYGGSANEKQAKKRAFSSEHPVFHIDNKTPIFRVRIASRKGLKPKEAAKNMLGITRKDSTNSIFRYVTYGNTHCVKIYKQADGAIQFSFITAWEYAQHIRGGGSRHLPQNAEHIMTLHKNETVYWRGKYYRIKDLDFQNKKFVIVSVQSSIGDAVSITKKEVEGLNKVAVNILGKVRDQAGD